jgi:hypothetical protein
MQSGEDSGFVAAADREFAFLVEEFGFTRVSSTAERVDYRSPSVALGVYYDPRTTEVGIELSPSRDAESYTIQDVLLRSDAGSELPLGELQAGSPQAREFALQKLGALLRRYGSDLLSGNRFAFRQLESARDTHAERETDRLALDDLRGRAADAWRQKDYRRVRDVYSQMEPDLTPSERKKLAYAIQQLTLREI